MLETSEERQESFLAFSAVLGGGLIAYIAASAAQEKGGVLGTDRDAEMETAGIVPLGVGLALTGMAVKDAAKQVGWAPLIWGSVAVGVSAFVVRELRG